MNDMRHDYPECYRTHVMKTLSNIFVFIARSNCNRWDILNRAIGGTAFSEIHHRGNPKYLNMGYLQLLETIEFEDSFAWKSTQLSEADKEIDETILLWEGKLLAYFQWKYSIDFQDWLKYESVKSIYDIFYPLHEASYDVASDKLYERYQYFKQENTN